MILQTSFDFDGSDYEPSRDKERLSRQVWLIFEAMKDGNWRTLSRIHAMTGAPEASISAQLRNMRKPRFSSQFGAFAVEKRRVSDTSNNGLWEYRVVVAQ